MVISTLEDMRRLRATIDNETPSGKNSRVPSGKDNIATPSGIIQKTPSGPHSRQLEHHEAAHKTPSGNIFFNTLVDNSFTAYTDLSNIHTPISDNFTGGGIF